MMRSRRAIKVAFVVMAISVLLAAIAVPSLARTVRFAGHDVRVPRSWPVYRLAEHPQMCVRLDRRAVYLGRPSPNQHCPARVIGSRRAILVEPTPSRSARTSSPFAAPSSPTPAGLGIYTGLGFDACTAPSTSTMAAWLASPYRAIGIYIGGVSRGCAQPNLNASWVSTEIAAGWHLMPIYVGRQAPTTGCDKCKTRINPDRAFAQGSEAADDAVAKAAALGIGPRSPIYFNMENYTRTVSASATVLSFFEGWTGEIHSLGYLSGVYVGAGSGLLDLVGKLGTGYTEPDDLWFAHWPKPPNAFDPALPESAWMPHRRIHQYLGESPETWGGAYIKIDRNYVDAATVTFGETEPLGSLDSTGSPSPGQVRTTGWGFDPNAPTQPLTIRAYVGGRAGDRGAVRYELGVVATRSRPDIAASYPEAGSPHGFDVTFPVLQYGMQQVCVYAVGIPPGAEQRLLGCRSVQVPVAINLSQVTASRGGVRAKVSCEWPATMSCQGRLKLRAAIAGKKYWLGRIDYRLQGKRSHVYAVPLNREGVALLKRYGKLTADVIATVSGGGRRIVPVAIRNARAR